MKYIEQGWGDIGLGVAEIVPQFWTPEQAEQRFLALYRQCRSHGG